MAIDMNKYFSGVVAVSRSAQITNLTTGYTGYIVKYEDGTEEFVSNERCRISDGLIEQYNFIQSERQSPPERRACLGVDFDDGAVEVSDFFLIGEGRPDNPSRCTLPTIEFLDMPRRRPISPVVTPSSQSFLSSSTISSVQAIFSIS